MAASELPPGLFARRLGRADIPQASALVEEAGWNQVAADWGMFIALGEVIAVTDGTGSVVATAATLPHGPRFGWISMVLVTGAWRRRGIARWLLGRSIAVLTEAGHVPLLDATPAGRAVYLGLGFRDVWGLTRLVRGSPSLRAPLRRSAPRNDGAKAMTDGTFVRPIEQADWPALIALDGAVFGGERAPLLKQFAIRLPEVAFVAERKGQPVGFLLGREGRIMGQLGPLIAEDEVVAQALLAPALTAVPGPLAIDLADRHAGLRDWLTARDFLPERPLTRMALGAGAAFDDSARYVALAGPEFG